MRMIFGSGKGQGVEQRWEEYFADPSQWWDNSNVDKVSENGVIQVLNVLL